eukprot:CAMPEP_0178766586 /NCGR_PEP_ID=MMETSP0744-20121128/19149_1 /TAXON_ID=913974 /ORGANISM="Nitzschia punctata, Strain CCMP561" /LENGTH=324 /DNA_ID=CAMNT_0020422329 /DNA_START=177 /DNA_END=1151 /DNA_ORIENTATION=-
MNLTKFSPPEPGQTATLLDIDFTCIYNDFSREVFSYTYVPPTFVLVEPGDRIAFYSTPPNIYAFVERDDGNTISLAHNIITEEPGETAFVITWPANQLEQIRMGGINATLLLAEGFTNLREINVTGELGGLEGYISSSSAYMKLRGVHAYGTHVQVVSDETQELVVDIETGVGDMEIIAPANTITGLVHSIRNTERVGNVFLDGVKAVESTGLGPGQLYADDCSKVTGNCNSLNDTDLESPNTDCRLADTCLVTLFTRTQPARTCISQLPEAGTPCGGSSSDSDNNGGGSGTVASPGQQLKLHGLWFSALVLASVANIDWLFHS